MGEVRSPVGGSGRDPLEHATPRRLFGVLAELGRSATTDELAALARRHPNGVRVHLQRMQEAGLVVRRRVPLPRGRPRDEWAISPTAAPAGDRPRADGALAGWLARAIPPTPRRLREVERTGRAIGRELAPGGARSAAQGILDALAALGFQPRVEGADGALRCTLRNCPYRDSVRQNQPVVCTLHRGLTRGLLDVLAPGARLTRFIPHDPETAGCEIVVEPVPAGAR
jgi:predicted ArsR family transcriptional regulator